MNFGNWIVVAFIMFAIFIGSLVFVCVRQDISLVSKDYYNEELIYQEQIKRISNTNELREKPTISKVDVNTVELHFATEFDVKRGELKLFRPSNPAMDKVFEIVLSKNNMQSFDVASMEKGMYRARISWEMDGKEFFFEEIILI